MDEEKDTQKEAAEDTAEDTEKRDKSKATPLIEQADAAAERLEAANKKQEELLKKQEEIMAKQRLGGQAEAGAETPKPEKETDEEYAKRVERGEANPLQDDGFI